MTTQQNKTQQVSDNKSIKRMHGGTLNTGTILQDIHDTSQNEKNRRNLMTPSTL